ncbi:MAG: CPBP family intramembrane metalloprotease [Chloroflexi bacterium]|nr:CPBP family intramembrane metalloprotease [Chloroflexota bacterium]
MLKRLLGEKLHIDWRIAVLTVASTLLIMFDWYGIGSKYLRDSLWWFEDKGLERVAIYFVIPTLITLFIFREKPGVYGFTLGDWKAGVSLTILSIALIAPVLWLVARNDPSMQSYYRDEATGLPWNTLIDLFGWEYIFRGWLLFGYARKFGPEAIWLQAVPFAVAHLSKPALETFSTIFGGFAFGWVAWRTKSFLYPLLIHWFVSSFTIVVAAGLVG